MKTLLAHEKKAAVPIIPGMQAPVSDDSSTSDSEMENSKGPSTYIGTCTLFKLIMTRVLEAPM